MKLGGFFIAVAIVLSACSGDPQPREPSPAPSATATSTATPPAMPAQASEDSPEGAAAFVTYWVKVSNYAAATGDVDELSRISSPDCSGCQKYIDLYRDTYEAGGYFKGGDWMLGEFEVRKDDSQFLLTTDLTLSPSKFKLSSDDDEGNGRGEDTRISFGLSTSKATMTQLFLGDIS